MRVTDDVQLPAIVDFEEVILGSLLVQPDLVPEVRAVLEPKDFSDTACQALFSAIDVAAELGEPIEYAALAERLKKYPADFRDQTPLGFMLEVAQEGGDTQRTMYYAGEVLRASIKRQLVELGESTKPEAMNGRQAETILGNLTARASELNARLTAINNPRDKFTFAQLSQQYPELHLPIVEGVARQAEVANIVSHSKFGKSWFIYHLLLCIITGIRWLGRFNVLRGPCLLVDNELHKPTIAYRIRKVAEAMGLKPSDYEHDLEIWSYRGKLCDLRDLGDELRPIKPGRYKAIVLDSKYRFATPGVSENDNNSATLDYNICADIADHSLAALFLILHSSKGNQSDKSIVDTGAGAGSQARACDTHLVLREHQQPGVAVLDAAVRSFAPIEPLALRWEFPLWLPTDDVDPAQLKRQPSGSEQRQQDSDRAGMDKIFKALRRGPSTARALRELTGMGKDKQQRLLDLIVAQGHATTKPITIRGNECREYTLCEDTD